MEDFDLEREFQRMLVDRSADVPGSAAPYTALTQRIATDRRHRRMRAVGAVAASAVAVAGAGAFAAGSFGHRAGRSSTSVVPTTTQGVPRKDWVATSSTTFAYDDGQTAFLHGSLEDKRKHMTSGYVGYMAKAAEDYLARAGVALPAGGSYTVVTTFNHQMMDDAIAAADSGLWHSTHDAGWNPARHPADKNVHLAFSAVDPATGYVKAFYSGVDGVENYDVNRSNAAMDGGVLIGATVYPITMATALETGGFSADSREPASNTRQLYWPLGCTDPKCALMDEASGKSAVWPPNSDDGMPFGEGTATLKQGMASSLAPVFADLGMEPAVTPKGVAVMATSLGLDPKSMSASPVLTLGAAPASPTQMAGVYATFAAGGVHHDPVMVSKVVDSGTGQVVWTAPVDGAQVMKPTTAAGVSDALKGVVASGTAAGNPEAKALAGQVPGIAGKTATNDNGLGAWFDGYSSKLSTAVTVYRQDPTGKMEPITGLESDNAMHRINGMAYPTSVWAEFMRLTR